MRCLSLSVMCLFACINDKKSSDSSPEEPIETPVEGPDSADTEDTDEQDEDSFSNVIGTGNYIYSGEMDLISGVAARWDGSMEMVVLSSFELNCGEDLADITQDLMEQQEPFQLAVFGFEESKIVLHMGGSDGSRESEDQIELNDEASLEITPESWRELEHGDIVSGFIEAYGSGGHGVKAAFEVSFCKE